MALPESGNTDSNILQLGDIRAKQERSAGRSKRPPDSQKVDRKHTVATNCEVNSVRADKLEAQTTRSGAHLPRPDLSKEKNNTPNTNSRTSNRRFDTAKVARIKAALNDESYEIDFLRVADKFIENERFG